MSGRGVCWAWKPAVTVVRGQAKESDKHEQSDAGKHEPGKEVRLEELAPAPMGGPYFSVMTICKRCGGLYDNTLIDAETGDDDE